LPKKLSDRNIGITDGRQGHASAIWEAVMLVLLMGRIYGVCHWDGLGCHNVHTEFHEDWFRLSKVVGTLSAVFVTPKLRCSYGHLWIRFTSAFHDWMRDWLSTSQLRFMQWFCLVTAKVTWCNTHWLQILIQLVP
jgi:hypothetical protein